ncbi:MAG TPA: VWA domain-containing protein [Bryobacteraceae bacterium]|nr:VWA domain-containing protein [Bryobacteraceae bacterium]
MLSRGKVAFLFASILVILARAQTPNPPRADLRVETTLVLVPVTVTDARHRYVLGLDRENFHVLEDGVEQKVKQFSGEDAPLSVGFVVDTSASIGSKIDLCRQAVVQFLKTMNAQDEAFLVTFNDHAQVIAPLTRDTGKMANQLMSVPTGGLTALFDGVFAGLHEMEKAVNPRKTLVVISDGGDNNSAFSAKEVLQKALESSVQIYAMGVFESLGPLGLSLEEQRGPRLLSNISEQTGGRAFAASRLDQLPEVAARIAVELRNQYVLAYSPSNEAKDGTYRKLEVKLSQPEGMTGLVARWRLGYYAPMR